MSAVFDASALIAFLRDEPGAEAVQELLERNTASNYVHALNLCGEPQANTLQNPP